MSQPLAKTHVCLDVASSTLTGQPFLVADLRQLTLSIQSQTNTASRYTVVGTNFNEANGALPNASQTVNGVWSILTALTEQGMYNIAPGFRWINVFRPSASSITATFHGRT